MSFPLPVLGRGRGGVSEYLIEQESEKYFENPGKK